MNRLISLSNLKCILECRPLSTKYTADGKVIPKKKNYESRVTLIGTDDSVSITDLKSAMNISVRRDLKLVKIHDEDSKTRRPVYKLMTSAEYHAEELERRKEKQAQNNNSLIKGDKLLTLSSRIGQHDLTTTINKMVKLLEKQYEVKIVISGDSEDNQKTEEIYSIIEKSTKSKGKVLQKRNKGNSLRLQIQPIRELSTQINNQMKPKDSEKGPL